jgi:hypothetical protein
MPWIEKYKKKLAVIILFGLLSPPAASAEVVRITTVDVIGTGKACGSNISKAREQAIADALVSAMESALSEIISKDLLIHDFKKLNNIVYRHPDIYITSYKVLSELSSGSKYRVMVRADISVDKLEKRLSEEGILIGKAALPTTFFLITEQDIHDPVPRYWWSRDMLFFESTAEKIMAASMADKGFYVINHGIRMPSLDGDTIIYPMNLSDTDAMRIGTLLKADIVVVGNAVVNKTTNRMGTNIRAFEGIVNARVLRVDNGAEIATTSKTAAAVDSDENLAAQKALSSAGQLAAEDLASQIISSLQDKKETEKLELIVQGADDLSNFVMFRGTLENIPGVVDVQTKQIEPGQTTMMVLFKGSAQELADAMMLKTFIMFGISINNISENHLNIELIQG